MAAFIEITIDRVNWSGCVLKPAEQHKEMIHVDDVRRVMPDGTGAFIYFLVQVPLGWTERDLRQEHISESYAQLRAMLDQASHDGAPATVEQVDLEGAA